MNIKPLLIDAVGLAGVGLITYGGWLISPPAGFITAGCLLTAWSLFKASR